MFLHKDEFLILMVLDAQRDLHTPDVLDRMRKIGIQTCHEQLSWVVTEPAKGSYDFSQLNRIISNNSQAGIKSLIQISGMEYPKWMPDEWFFKCKDGTVDRNGLSFWNEEAQTHVDHYYQMLINMYVDDPNVMFFLGEYQGGEGAMPPTWCIYDDSAISQFQAWYGKNRVPDPDDMSTIIWLGDTITNHFTHKSSFFFLAYNEAWNAQQWLMNKWTKAFGNFTQPVILSGFRTIWPDSDIMLLQYTYFDKDHPQENADYVDNLREISGCHVIAEAMFCKGLAETTPKSIAKGFRGQIVCPTDPHTGEKNFQTWMFDAIEQSHNAWKESKE